LEEGSRSSKEGAKKVHLKLDKGRGKAVYLKSVLINNRAGEKKFFEQTEKSANRMASP